MSVAPAQSWPPRDPLQVDAGDLAALSQWGRTLGLPRPAARARHGGEHRSPRRGRGMEFDESRPYQVGDDVRNFDWRVTARTGHPHTKLFREERERPILLAVDYRAAMQFATRGAFKAVSAAHLATLLGWACAGNHDRVGGLVFGDAEERVLRPRRGRGGVLRLIRALAERPAPGPESTGAERLAAALGLLRRLTRPGSLIALISDFRGLNPRAREHLLQLSRHNHLLLLQVYDALEAEPPPPGRYWLSDGRRRWRLELAGDRERAAHRQRFDAHRAALIELALACRARLLDCPTHRAPLTLLQGQLVRGGW